MKARILIVEDEAIVAEDIRDRLTHLGYDVIEPVATGEEALAVVADRRPSLVMMASASKTYRRLRAKQRRIEGRERDCRASV